LSVPGAPAGVQYRYVPDVSLLASDLWPGYIYCTELSELGLTGTGSSCAPGGAAGITNALALEYPSSTGGTSVSTPIFAGIVTLLNQYFQGAASTGLGNINPMLYKLAQTKSNNYFHQLTTGNNQEYCEVGQPSNQTVEPWLVCPASGIFGFDASNFDTKLGTGYNLVTGLGSVDANNLAIAWAATRTSTSTSFSSSTTSTYEGASVTLTATVASSLATGTVNFLNGSSSLGTATLSGGVATLPTTLPLGTDSITASYGGNGSYAGSTSSATEITVAAAYTLTATPITVSQGNPGNSTITVAAASGFTSAITFTCSDPASESTCYFSSTSITPPGQNTTTLTVTSTASTAQLHPPLDRNSKYFFAVLFPGFLGIVLTLGSGKCTARALRLLSFIAILGCSTLWLAACGGGGGSSGNPGTPKNAYTIVVTATSGTITHKTTFTFTVD
jgi:hypothetical protein